MVTSHGNRRTEFHRVLRVRPCKPEWALARDPDFKKERGESVRDGGLIQRGAGNIGRALRTSLLPTRKDVWASGHTLTFLPPAGAPG
jgi:hypothetical protein